MSIEAIGSKNKTSNVNNFFENFNNLQKKALNGDAKFSVQLPLFGYGYANNQVNAADSGQNVGSYRVRI